MRKLLQFSPNSRGHAEVNINRAQKGPKSKEPPNEAKSYKKTGKQISADKSQNRNNKESKRGGSCCFLFQLNNVICASLEDDMRVLVSKLYPLPMQRKIRAGLMRGKNTWYQFRRCLLSGFMFSYCHKNLIFSKQACYHPSQLLCARYSLIWFITTWR